MPRPPFATLCIRPAVTGPLVFLRASRAVVRRTYSKPLLWASQTLRDRYERISGGSASARKKIAGAKKLINERTDSFAGSPGPCVL
jgi:hypothetical protein